MRSELAWLTNWFVEPDVAVSRYRSPEAAVDGPVEIIHDGDDDEDTLRPIGCLHHADDDHENQSHNLMALVRCR